MGQNPSEMGKGNRFSALNEEEIKEGKESSAEIYPNIDPVGMASQSTPNKADAKSEKKRGKGVGVVKEDGFASVKVPANYYSFKAHNSVLY